MSRTWRFPGDPDTWRLATILVGITVGASLRNAGWWIVDHLTSVRPPDDPAAARGELSGCLATCFRS